MRKAITLITLAALSLSATASLPATAAESDYLLHSTFEDGKEQWSGRGSASVKIVSEISRSGEYSLMASRREADWNGATVPLGPEFRSGQSYAFSAYVMTEDTSSPVTFYLTLQYQNGDTTVYPKIAEVTAEKGQWAQLENNDFTIPSEATDIQLYVETDGSKCSFYVDEVVGAKSGSEISEPPPATKMRKGDINYDGLIDIFDVILARKAIINETNDKKTLKAADADNNNVFEVADLVLINQFSMGIINEFPVVEPVIIPGQVKYTM